MFSQLFNLALLAPLAVTGVSALVIPRSTPPAGWATGYLEDYDVYHTRYLALNCQNKHNSAFFDACCHPMLASETLATARAAECVPSASASASASAVEPTSTDIPDVGGDDGEEDCDDEGDDEGDDEDCEDEDSSSAPAPATSAASSSSAIVNAAPTPIAVSSPSATAPTSSKASSAQSSPAPAPTSEKPSSTAAPASTPKPTVSKTSSSKAPAPTSGNAQQQTGGIATFFTQNGVAGACGTVHSDNDLIAAIDSARYGDTGVKSSLCGKQVEITNQKNGKTVTVTIADACPTCENSNSIDLSTAAFNKIADPNDGIAPIVWEFVN